MSYWYNQHLSRGFTPGIMLSQGDLAYIPIPKNASSCISFLLASSGWASEEYLNTDISNKKFIVVLRDPLERWLSGITQYLCSFIVAQGYTAEYIMGAWNNITDAIVFDQCRFDDHSEKQVYYLEHVPLENCVWFRCVDAGISIKEFLDDHGLDLNINVATPRNRTIDNLQQKLLTDFIKSRLDDRKIQQIRQVYREDYELIERVKFYD